jgi:hypothetical protein
MFFSRVSEATLGSFSGHFWDVLGAKLGGVSAFRVVSIGRAVARCKIARLKASKRQESYRKGSQKNVFSYGFRSDRQHCKDDSIKSMYWAVVHEGQKASRKPIRSSQDERF